MSQGMPLLLLFLVIRHVVDRLTQLARTFEDDRHGLAVTSHGPPRDGDRIPGVGQRGLRRIVVDALHQDSVDVGRTRDRVFLSVVIRRVMDRVGVAVLVHGYHHGFYLTFLQAVDSRLTFRRRPGVVPGFRKI